MGEGQTQVIRPRGPRRPRSGRWPVVWIVLVVVGLVLGGLLATFTGGEGDVPPTTAAAPPPLATEQETTTTTVEPDPVSAPDLVGADQATAESALDELGLRYSVAEVPSDEEPGTVVSQNPPPGTSLEVGDGVHLNVSRGRPDGGGDGDD